MVLPGSDRGVHGIHDLSGLSAFSPIFLVLGNRHCLGHRDRLVGRCGIPACEAAEEAQLVGHRWDRIEKVSVVAACTRSSCPPSDRTEAALRFSFEKSRPYQKSLQKNDLLQQTSANQN